MYISTVQLCLVAVDRHYGSEMRLSRPVIMYAYLASPSRRISALWSTYSTISSSSVMRQIRRIRRSLDAESAKTLVHAFITSRIDGCNTVLDGSPRTITDRCRDVGSSLCRFSGVVLCGVSGLTWVVRGPNTWDAAGGHGPGDVRDGCLTMTDGLVSIGDCVVQLSLARAWSLPAGPLRV